jgi:hypothetical protein
MKKVLSLAAAIGLSLSFAAVAQAGGACCKAQAGSEQTAAAGCCKAKAGAEQTAAADGCCKNKAGAEQTAAAGACCKSKAAATAAGATCTEKAAASATCTEKTAIAAKCCAVKGGPTCVEGMPKMGYRVGDKTVTCPDEARKLMSENKDAAISFVVGDKSYSDQAEATKAYGALLDSYLKDMLTVREIAASGDKPVRYELAGFTYDCREKAEKAAAAARTAAEQVTMNYRVAGKTFHCPDEAKKAVNGDAQIEYVVGESVSTCNVRAGVDLARARIAAAMKALEGSPVASRS